MKLTNELRVDAPVDRTWETMLDVERVAGCLPGATIEPLGEDGAYRGAMKLKVGPVSLAYGGTVRQADVDVDGHVVTFDARAKEAKGTGTASALITSRLTPDGDGTRVVVETDLNVTGRPAQFGRGMMQDVASKMLDQFAGRLEQAILAGPGAPAPDVSAGAPGPAAAAGGPPPADEASLDLGAMLLSGYKCELGIAGVVLAVVGGLLLRRRRPRGFEFTVRYRP